MKDLINQRFKEHADTVTLTIDLMIDRIAKASEMIINSLKSGGELYIFGNGGSAADAQHIAGELVGRYLKERPAIKARALTTDSTILTAVANDYDYDQIFTRQLEAVVKEGDVALGLTTSGNSPNVVKGLEFCKSRGVQTIALTSEGGGRCKGCVDLLLDIPSIDTPRVQEVTIIIYHTMCELIENSMCQ